MPSHREREFSALLDANQQVIRDADVALAFTRWELAAKNRKRRMTAQSRAVREARADDPIPTPAQAAPALSTPSFAGGWV